MAATLKFLMARIELPDLDRALADYRKAHNGRAPLYIIVSPAGADGILDEIRSRGGHPADVTITEYKGSKIVQHEAVLDGDMQLSDELPGVSG